MAGSKTNAYSDTVLNVLRGVNVTAPGTIYIALFTSAPGESGSGTEVTGGSYARKSITFGLPTAGAPRQVASSAQVDFAVATATWGTIVGWALFDALTVGTMMYYGDVGTTKLIETNDMYRFLTGAVIVTEQ